MENNREMRRSDMIGDQIKKAATNAISTGSLASGAQVGARAGLGKHATPSGAAQDHSAALDQLWRTHSPRLLQTAHRITRNREDAEDALQDAFLRAFVCFGSFDGRSSAVTWLTRIAINSALMILRKNKSSRELSFEPSAFGEGQEFARLTNSAPDPETRLVQSERHRMLRDAVQTLQPHRRQAIVLQKLEERSMKEAAELMGVSVSAAKARVHHAKAEMRAALAAKLSVGTCEVKLRPAA
jgi:RNA polymerase sigma factor (sigma-70 family)